MHRIAATLAALLLAVPFLARPEEAPVTPATPAKEAATEGGAKAPVAADALVGEVVLLPANTSASYGATRVVGPRVNLTQSQPGTWKGNIRDFNGVLEVTAKRISGAAFNVVVDRDGEEWTAQGTWEGRRVRIAFEKDGLTAKVDNRYYEMKRVAPDLYATVPAGPGLRVKGDAASAGPLYPQFVLALLAVL